MQPGECKKLKITSIPKSKEVVSEFWIPVLGGYSVWFEDKVALQGTACGEEHYNYNLEMAEPIFNAWVSLEAPFKELWREVFCRLESYIYFQQQDG